MRHHNWVCVPCRQAIRRPPAGDALVRCGRCGEACEGVGDQLPIPARSDARAWADLGARLDRSREERVESAREAVRRWESSPDGVQREHELRWARRRLRALVAVAARRVPEA